MMSYMRINVSLEEDLSQRVAEIALASGDTFTTVLNEVLRRGLGIEAPMEPAFAIQGHAGNLKPGIDDRGFNELAWE